MPELWQIAKNSQKVTSLLSISNQMNENVLFNNNGFDKWKIVQNNNKDVGVAVNIFKKRIGTKGKLK